MAVTSEPTQVLALPGLDRASLVKVLSGTRPQPSVTTVVLHVGVNDCARGYILGNGAWRNIIFQATRTFPNARLFLSSILPHRDQHAHYSACIMDSNKAMQLSCRRLKAAFIDNDCSFFSHDGQVKSGWMRDQIHPNSRGSSSLAVNIKRSYSARLHASKPSTPNPLYNRTNQTPLRQPLYHTRNPSHPIRSAGNQPGNYRQYGYKVQPPPPSPLFPTTHNNPQEATNYPPLSHHRPLLATPGTLPPLPTPGATQGIPPGALLTNPMGVNRPSYLEVASGHTHNPKLFTPQLDNSAVNVQKAEPINMSTKQKHIDVKLLMELLDKLIQ